jgi:4-carboxymuconolactone decarboxylase
VTLDANRLSPVPVTEWDDETRTVLLAHLRRPELYLSGAPDAPPMPVVLELFANHRALSEAWLPFTSMLAGPESVLEPAVRELAILRVAWRTRSGYEWSQHARMGRDAGLSDTQVAGAREELSVHPWSPRDLAVLAAADELVQRSRVEDATWHALGEHFAPDHLLELLFVIGGYLCLAGVLNSIGLQGELPAS